MERKEKKTIIVMFMIVIVLASLPLFGTTIFAPELLHDHFFHTQRIWSIKNALEEGQFPVRIYSEIYNGYGYGAPLYYPDIFLYIPAMMCLFGGLPLSVSYNIFLFLVNIATISIAYYSYSRVTRSRIIGAVAAIFYTLSTYRFIDMYTRGAVGELLALVFCPLILCGFTLLKRGEYDKWWILVIAYTGLLQSHMLSSVMLVGMGVFWVLWNKKSFFNRKGMLALVKAGGIFVLLNLWFLLPLLREMQEHSIVGTPDFWDSGASIVKLFDVLLLSVTGIETFGGEIAQSIPKTPGVLLIFGALFLTFSLILYEDKIKEEMKCVFGYLVWGTLFTVSVTNLFPWKIIQKIVKGQTILTNFQFVWRFNILAILFLSLAAAYGFYYFFIQEATDKLKTFVIIGMMAGVFSLVFTNQYVGQTEQYDNEEVLQNGYMDRLYLAPDFEYLCEEIESNANVLCSESVHEYGCFSCRLTFDGTETMNDIVYVDVPLAYYAGYEAYINGEKIKTGRSSKGVVRVYLPEAFEAGNLEVFYKDSVVVKIANVISLMSATGLLCILFVRKFRKK